MFAYTIGTHEALLALIGVVFILLVVIGFLPDPAISRGSAAADDSKSVCI
jgi:hypothetical protein